MKTMINRVGVSVLFVLLGVGCNQPVCDLGGGTCVDAGAGGGGSAGDVGTGGAIATGGGGGTGGNSATGGGAMGGGEGGGVATGGGAATGGGFATGGGSATGGGTGGGSIVVPYTCGTPKLVGLPKVGEELTFDADTLQGIDDASGSCNLLGGGKELVYRLSIPAATTVTITAARPAGSLANPVLYVRGSPCDTAAEIACSNLPAPNAVETVTLSNKPAGDYFLFVEGVGANVGVTQVTLKVSVGNDDCDGAQALAFTGAVATATGNTNAATNSNSKDDASPSCSPTGASDGQDLVYSYTLTQARDVNVTVTPGNNSNLKPVAYVRKAGTCTSTSVADELGCFSTGAEPAETPAVVELFNQPAGTYFVFVDGAQSSSGSFVLDVTLSPPTAAPANDVCAGATPLTFVGSVAVASGDTKAATNGNAHGDATPSCSAQAADTGRDVVFSYTLTAAKDVEITVTPKATSPGFFPVAYVRKPNACASAVLSDQVGCVSTTGQASSGPLKFTLYNQPAGTYSLFIDGEDSTYGAFDIDIALGGPTLPQPNDSCASPTVLTVGGAPVAGNNTIAFDDMSESSNPPYSEACDFYSWHGKDLVYQFTAGTTGTVHIEVDPQSSDFDPGIMVLTGTCSAASCVSANDRDLSGETEELELAVVAGQTYYLVVDNFSNSGFNGTGAFTISVK